MDELDLLKKKLRELMNDITDQVATGGCKDIEDYRYLTGKIYGIALAERELLDLKQKLESDDGD